MNKHFKDTKYYLKRAGEHAKAGVSEELEPLKEKFNDVIGREEEPEPSRIDEIREKLTKLEEKAEGDAKEAVGNARQRLDDYRSED